MVWQKIVTLVYRAHSYFRRNSNKNIILDNIQEGEYNSIIDLGGSDGSLVKSLLTKIKAKKIFVADHDKKSLSKAPKNIETICIDLNSKIPLKDKSMDLVISSQVIEHLQDPDTFVKEIYRLLKPGAVAVITTPNLASLHARIFLLFGITPSCLHPARLRFGIYSKKAVTNYLKNQYGHKSVFTVSALRKLFSHYGFKVLKSKSYNLFLTPEFISRIICKILNFGNLQIIIVQKPSR